MLRVDNLDMQRILLSVWLIAAVARAVAQVPAAELLKPPANARHFVSRSPVGSGPAAQTITLWTITGMSTSPLPIWADSRNKFFGVAFGLAWLPDAYAGEQARIEETQAKAMAAQAPGLVRSLVKVPPGPVAFIGVRLFDADADADADALRSAAGYSGRPK
jgi:hypothetical protein